MLWKCVRLIIKAIIFMMFILSIVAIFMAASLMYYKRNRRIIAEFPHGDKDVVVVVNGKASPVDVFMDCTSTFFYDLERDYEICRRDKVDRRLLIMLQDDKYNDARLAFEVSRFGIGKVACNPDVYSCFGTKILIGPELMNVAYDVRDDMKGLDAVVESRRDNSYVEYFIVGRWHGRLEIVIKINANLHDYICGVDLVQNGVNAARSRLSAPPPPSQSPARPIFRIADLPKVATKPIASSGDVLADVRVDPAADAPARASELNQAMDALLDQPEIPADYGETMVSIFRDRSCGVLERGFAVQHIGLYVAALNRRGVYDPAESSSLRAALWDASLERDSGVGAAALRALADIEEFDPNVDAGRLNSILVECAVDQGSAPAVRIMAVQLCGERTVRAVRPALESILSDGAAPETLRRSAQYALSRIDGKEISQ